MDRRLIAGLIVLAAGCSRGESSSSAAAAHDSGSTSASPAPSRDSNHTSTTSAGGEVASSQAAAPANRMGRIPVLEYHIIGGQKNELYTRTAASFRSDMEAAYKLGFRPITITQMLDKD